MKKVIMGICLAVSVIGSATAVEPAVESCTEQTLNPASAVRQLYPGESKEVLFRASSGETAARLILSASEVSGQVIVDVRLENIGKCEVTTFQPVKLHPIRNGLPLGWHSLPQGIHANPKLAVGAYVQYRREYPSDYAGGFNLAFGSWQMLASPEPQKAEENAPLSEADELFSDVLSQDSIQDIGENPEMERHLSNFQERAEMFDQAIGTMRQVQTLQLQEEAQKAAEQAAQQKQCPPGYGLSWEGVCHKCDGPTTALVCN